MNAIDVYTGPLGDGYWARNKEAVMRQRWIRRAWLRVLAPEWARFQWLEVGCGVGANLYDTDYGVDIVSHPRVDAFGDIRALYCASRSFAVAFCVGVLMHLPDGEWQKGLNELCRVAEHAVIIGEYVAPAEHDLLWNPETGHFENGQPGLLWERPYPAPEGWRLQETRRPLPGFDPRVEFRVFVPATASVLP